MPAPLPLSPRESALCRLAGAGLTNKAIAAELGISVHTVGSFWRRIFAKLGCSCRAAAAVRFAQGPP